MALDVPVGMCIRGVVFLVAADLNLFETPLWQYGICSFQVAIQQLVTEPHASRQGVNLLDLGTLALLQIVHNFHNPVVLLVANRLITITGDFVV